MKSRTLYLSTTWYLLIFFSGKEKSVCGRSIHAHTEKKTLHLSEGNLSYYVLPLKILKAKNL